ncbi:MAG: DUF309 domain-containing protein [Deltaproteobacteria bacterium]|nr:DUF309 domain-containing protein [Deltaproteobacteria bacterium]
MLEFDAETKLALDRGAQLFNDGAYFEAHEVWEDAWRIEVGRIKTFLQGLIKVAAGFYKAEGGVPAGAIKLLRGGLEQLQTFSDDELATPLALAKFVKGVAACLAAIERDPTHRFSKSEVPFLGFAAEP